MDSKFEPVMSGGTPSATPPASIPVAVDSSRVLRNTYWLLALSLLPTIAGAFAGMELNFISFFKTAPIMTPLVMLGVMLGSLWVVTLLRNSAWGVAALFGFTFIAGLMLTPILTVAAGFRNGGQLVALSGGLTASVFFALAAYATVSKRDFSFLGKFLFVGVILLLVAMVANLFFQVPAASLALSAIAVLIFSLYLLYDLSNTCAAARRTT
jgi:modulator of FtsH protease